mmetsp:Transcript_196/g.469  ORF Transcript_196/g.469 Transcript_196/m.469 type:complete len:318 (+) Transcript_196:1073-2026(+)
MGQKTNSIILRLGIKKNEWVSKYYEQNSEEHTLYNFKDLQIRKYLKQALYNEGLMLHSCKTSYTDKSVYIYVSYYQTIDSIDKISKSRSKQKIIIHEYEPIKKTWRWYKKKKLNKRFSLVKRYKNFLLQKKFVNKPHLSKNSFFNNLLESISLYTNKKLNIIITFKNIKNKFLKLFKSYKEKKKLRQKIFSLRKYHRNLFFEEGVNILLLTLKIKNSSQFFANYISNQINNIGRKHNYFLVFLKRIITMFIDTELSKVKGIKIVIKGRINGRPRAKKRLIEIGQVPIQTLKSKIDYSESTSYTPNGTFGIKVWICYK